MRILLIYGETHEMPDCLIEELGEDGVLRLRLNRPDKLNALDPELLDALIDAQRSVAEKDEVRVVLLSGEGRSFCAGADLHHTLSIHPDRNLLRDILSRLRDAVTGFERINQPVIGALHGHVLAGGLELAMGCDILLAARSAQIGDQHIRRNLIPGGGNTQRIPRHLGKARALDLLLTGRWLSAQEACDCGLVSRVCDDEILEGEAEALARELAESSPQALREIKRLTHLAYSTPLADGLELEIDASVRYFTSDELTESLNEFKARSGRGS